MCSEPDGSLSSKAGDAVSLDDVVVVVVFVVFVVDLIDVVVDVTITAAAGVKSGQRTES